MENKENKPFIGGGFNNYPETAYSNIVGRTKNSLPIDYSVIPATTDTIGYSTIIGGNSCTAVGSYSMIVGAGNTQTIISDEDFFKAQSLEYTKDSFIVKFYPKLYQWQIYNQGNLIITQDVEMEDCSLTSKLFYHNYRQIGVFIVSGASLEAKENVCVLTGVKP